MTTDQSISVRGLLETAVRRLDAVGVESPRLDAEVLLAAATGATRAQVLAGIVPASSARTSAPGEHRKADAAQSPEHREAAALAPNWRERFEQMLARRSAREPVAYIVGHKEFYSLDFEVNPAVLVPRPHTETVVTVALDAVSVASARKPEVRILELGTGSGAIAVALAANSPRVRLVATDISAAALAMAGRNAARHRVAPRIEFRRADLFAVTDGGPPLGRFDIIISNPPYIDDESRARLDPEIRLYEPQIALAGGRDGLDFFRAIAGGAGEHLELDGGRGGSEVIVEVGAGQANAVVAIFNRMLTDAGLQRTSVINDLDAIPRVVRVRP